MSKQELKKDYRPAKARVIALSRKIYRIRRSDSFYVESENRDSLYYFVHWNWEEPTYNYCSCSDSSVSQNICKHIQAIEYAIKWGTTIDVDRLPSDVLRDNQKIESDEFDW